MSTIPRKQKIASSNQVIPSRPRPRLNEYLKTGLLSAILGAQVLFLMGISWQI